MVKGNFPGSPIASATGFLPAALYAVVVSQSMRFSLFHNLSVRFFLRDWVRLDLGFSGVRVDSPCHYAKSEPIRCRFYFIFEYNILSKHTKIKRYTGSLARNSREFSSHFFTLNSILSTKLAHVS